MVRNNLRFGLSLIAQGFTDPSVKLLTRGLWKTSVDNVSHQRVFERVDRIGWHTAAKQQPRVSELV